MFSMGKERVVELRMSETDYESLRRVAEHHGLGIVALVRFLVRKEERTLQASVPPKSSE